MVTNHVDQRAEEVMLGVKLDRVCLLSPGGASKLHTLESIQPLLFIKSFMLMIITFRPNCSLPEKKQGLLQFYNIQKNMLQEIYTYETIKLHVSEQQQGLPQKGEKVQFVIAPNSDQRDICFPHLIGGYCKHELLHPTN